MFRHRPNHPFQPSAGADHCRCLRGLYIDAHSHARWLRPWPYIDITVVWESASATTFAVSSAIWLVIVQWLSSGLGGYLTGRLRTKWVGLHTDETFFRDTAHGFLAWALATMLVVFVLGSATSAAVGTGVKAVSSVASGAALGASAGATSGPEVGDSNGMPSYFVDSFSVQPIPLA